MSPVLRPVPFRQHTSAYASPGDPICGEEHPRGGRPCQLPPDHWADIPYHARPASGGFDTWAPAPEPEPEPDDEPVLSEVPSLCYCIRLAPGHPPHHGVPVRDNPQA